jgi:2-polyprenyl-3-methyl-5-hydroxy-6-metoxy-1,4-benzoquinol methylase
VPETLLKTKFCCPECQGSFRAAGVTAGPGKALICGSCKSRVPVVDGIADFVRGRFDTALNIEAYEQEHGIDEAQAAELYRQIKVTAGHRWPNHLGSVVEIGCGTGFYSRGLLSNNEARDVVMTDVSVGMLRVCRRNLDRQGLLAGRSVAFATYSSHEASIRDAAFDSCVGTSVLHHIPDVGAFLAAVFRGIRPGGRAFFLEPNRRFYAALGQAVADIVTLLLPGYEGYPTALQPLFNWLATQRLESLHQGDIEFLSTLEDKHQFTAEEIARIGEEAGFATSEAIPFGPDPTGTSTLRGLLGEIGLEASLVHTVTRMMASIGPRYMSLLGPADRAPTLLIWLTKADDPVEPPSNVTPVSPPAALPDPMFGGVAVRSHLTVVATAAAGQLEVHVSGWCLSNLDIKWVRVRTQSETRNAPVWLPRPDVQRAMNPHGHYVPWNALCCGVDVRLSMGAAVRSGFGYACSVSLVFAGGAVIDIETPKVFPVGEAVSLWV